MILLPSQWVVIGSQIVSIIIIGLGAVDLYYHTNLLVNPATLVILTVLNAVGIHQTINPTIKK